MADCKAKSAQKGGREVNPTMHEMVLGAIRGCKDPTGITTFSAIQCI